MPSWQRPTFTPAPTTQIVTDHLRRLDPHRWAKRLALVVLAFVVGNTAWQWRATTAALGRTTPALVVVEPVAAGETITPRHVAVRRWPVGLLPPGHLATLPAEAIATADLVSGEVVIDQRLRSDLDDLTDDRRLFALPRPIALPPLAPGDRVDLFGLLPIGDGVTTPARLLTTGSIHDVTDTDITVVVDASAVPSLVEHAALGAVEIVGRGS